MDVRSLRGILALGLVALVGGCGGSDAAHSTAARGTAGTAAIEVNGRVAQRGTRGSVLVFAYLDLAPGDDPAAREPASVSTIGRDGSFDLDVPDAGSLSLVFLADGANDGAIDGGDPVATLSAPELAELQPGDRVQIGDAAIDFTAHRVTATVAVTRADGSKSPAPAPS
jgi:hypothetical protein